MKAQAGVRRTSKRMEERDSTLHDVLNALAVAKAVLEAMIDGVLEPSEERLHGVLDAVGKASDLLSKRSEE